MPFGACAEGDLLHMLLSAYDVQGAANDEVLRENVAPAWAALLELLCSTDVSTN